MSVEEIEKRIEELKAVQFWLEQNNRALNATVQALQVQKMTLSTLKGMNVNLNDLGKAFPFAAATAAAPSAASSAAPNPGNLSDWPMSGAAPSAAAEPAPQPEPAPQAEATKPEAPQASAASDTAAQAANMATAMQWWGALTQQFQHIAQQAMQDPAQQQAMAKATQMSSDFAKAAVKTAGDMVRQAVAQAKPTKSAKTAATSTAKTPASKPTPAKKPAAKRSAPAKKAVSADKKPTSAAARTRSTAAKKSSTSKTRAR